jgi:hypothetical protein
LPVVYSQITQIGKNFFVYFFRIFCLTICGRLWYNISDRLGFYEPEGLFFFSFL